MSDKKLPPASFLERQDHSGQVMLRLGSLNNGMLNVELALPTDYKIQPLKQVTTQLSAAAVAPHVETHATPAAAVEPEVHAEVTHLQSARSQVDAAHESASQPADNEQYIAALAEPDAAVVPMSSEVAEYAANGPQDSPDDPGLAELRDQVNGIFDSGAYVDSAMEAFQILGGGSSDD